MRQIGPNRYAIYDRDQFVGAVFKQDTMTPDRRPGRNGFMRAEDAWFWSTVPGGMAGRDQEGFARRKDAVQDLLNNNSQIENDNA